MDRLAIVVRLDRDAVVVLEEARRLVLSAFGHIALQNSALMFFDDQLLVIGRAVNMNDLKTIEKASYEIALAIQEHFLKATPSKGDMYYVDAAKAVLRRMDTQYRQVAKKLANEGKPFLHEEGLRLLLQKKEAFKPFLPWPVATAEDV